MTILFVCAGNTCRSPLAVAAWRALDVEEGAVSIENASEDALPIAVDSAGLSAQKGGFATAHAQKIARNWRTDLSSHRARLLTQKLARGTDFLVTMTSAQAQNVRADFGLPSHRVRVLSEFETSPRANRVLEERIREGRAGEARAGEDEKTSPTRRAARSEEERLAALLEEDTQTHLRTVRDIEDPFGGSFEAYESCAVRIKNAVATLRNALENGEIAP